MTAGRSADNIAARAGRTARSAGHRSQAFSKGANGERVVAEALAPLSAHGWVILHDRKAPAGGNVDHVLVGPGGVVVLDAKSWSGTPAIGRNGRLRVGPNDAHKSIDSLYAVLTHLREALGDIPVSGGLVFVGDTDLSELPAKVDGVGLTHVHAVTSILTGKTPTLSPADADRAAARVATALPPVGPVTLERPEPVAADKLDRQAVQAVFERPIDKRYRFYVARDWSKGAHRRVYLNAAGGTPLGWRDRKTGAAHVEHAGGVDAGPLLERLTSLEDIPTPDVSVLLPLGLVSRKLICALGHDRRGVGHVVGHVWRRGTLHRLHVTVHVPTVEAATIGWVDLTTGELHINDPERSGLLRHTWHVLFPDVVT